MTRRQELATLSSMPPSRYQRALQELPARVRREISFTPERFLPLHGDPGDDAPLQAAAAVARRSLIIHGSMRAVAHDDWDAVSGWFREEGLGEALSGKERNLFARRAPADREKLNTSWLIERLWVLLWALDKVPALGSPTRQCDPEDIDPILPIVGAPTASFVAAARLRRTGEILDQLSLIWQIRSKLQAAWIKACGKQRRIGGIVMVSPDPDKKRPPPLGGVDEGVALERYQALNWLVRYGNEDWDEVSTDT